MGGFESSLVEKCVDGCTKRHYTVKRCMTCSFKTVNKPYVAIRICGNDIIE